MIGLTCLIVFAGALANGDTFVVALLTACSFGAAYAVFGPAFGETVMVTWIWVSYRAGTDNVEELWIADAGRLGWNGQTGGTQAIYAAIGKRRTASAHFRLSGPAGAHEGRTE